MPQPTKRRQKCTTAIVVRIPTTLKFDDKKTSAKIDIALARKQQEDLNDTLREVTLYQIKLIHFELLIILN